jgi:hypothetical protein
LTVFSSHKEPAQSKRGSEKAKSNTFEVEVGIFFPSMGSSLRKD